MLRSTTESLAALHDVVMLDLDGVVYVGGEGVPGASEHLAACREVGTRLAFVTNNASRTPETVAEHLRRVGVDATVEDVVTSAQAAAALVRSRHGASARVAALGGEGLHAALAAEDLEVVGVGAPADVVVTGYGPDVLWRDVMAAAVAVRGGTPWVASNTDRTIPTPQGPAPGHGVLVEMLTRFAEVGPAVAGKPSPPLLRTTIGRTGASRPLMVGDRIDTDIEGGAAVDVATLLVMTGVSDAAALAECPRESRPTYLSADLAGLLEPQPEPRVDDDVAHVGGWRSWVEDDEAQVDGEGTASDWWRALATALWHHADGTGRVAGTALVHSRVALPATRAAGR
ncbi:HAD-IIA family hydrolase [Nocardioides zeae]|uniref:HAD-IIA family hydrolase n=1 Tax=Nocardioides imazamoxiresistens TaxID=3231893 RepID=A0ABU3PSL8_9ACTN|nr:HAD-IIA family hydrolase [Nocardioides zeae]MDT9592223.1 HAD-IIA family hydrolase [Nocardioides zeae]